MIKVKVYIFGKITFFALTTEFSKKKQRLYKKFDAYKVSYVLSKQILYFSGSSVRMICKK